jgi:hypothetical protein
MSLLACAAFMTRHAFQIERIVNSPKDNVHQLRRR